MVFTWYPVSYTVSTAPQAGAGLDGHTILLIWFQVGNGIRIDFVETLIKGHDRFDTVSKIVALASPIHGFIGQLNVSEEAPGILRCNRVPEYCTVDTRKTNRSIDGGDIRN